MSIDVKVHDNRFHLDGVDYFRDHAQAVQLGDAGGKKTPGAQKSYLAVYASVPRNKLTIERATQIDLHNVAISGSDIGAGITIPGVGTLGAATVARQLEDQALALVKLECVPQALLAAANDSPAVIAELTRASHAGRLVHQAFVILEMKMALNFTRSTRYELSGGAASWTVTGCSSSGSRTVVAITPGTTFAYRLCKPRWDTTLRKHGKRIGDWEDDPWSLGLSWPEAASA